MNILISLLISFGTVLFPAHTDKVVVSSVVKPHVVRVIPAKVVYVNPDPNKVEILSLVNKDRVLNGLKPLIEKQTLDLAAQQRADDMSVNSYFSHIGPQGQTFVSFVKPTGYQYGLLGENLAKFSGIVKPDFDYSLVEQAWMNSVKHRENILNYIYEDIGVGIKDDKIVTLFGYSN